MKYLIKAVATNNRDLRTSILFLHDEASYLFNVPDIFQRVASEQKVSLAKVKHAFLSSLHPDCFAGYPGFFLTRREILLPQPMEMNTYGPPGTKNILKSGLPFIIGAN